MIEETLLSIGLSKEEVDIYLSLIKNGAQSASTLSKTTKVKRTYVYKVCDGLIKKRLANIQGRGHGRLFHPNSPDYLLTLAERQKERADENKHKLEASLHKLKESFSMIEFKPVVKTYEGFEGLKKIYLDTISEAKPIFAFLQNADIQPEFRKWLREVYLKKRVSSNISAKVIVASGKRSKLYVDEDVMNLRESIEVDSKDFPFAVEANIYGDKVSFINYRDSDNPIGIIIDNGPIASTLRAFFDLNWRTLKESSSAKP